jgi:hypothetical protein
VSHTLTDTTNQPGAYCRSKDLSLSTHLRSLLYLVHFKLAADYIAQIFEYSFSFRIPVTMSGTAGTLFAYCSRLDFASVVAWDLTLLSSSWNPHAIAYSVLGPESIFRLFATPYSVLRLSGPTSNKIHWTPNRRSLTFCTNTL